MRQWHLHVRLALGKQALEGVQSTCGRPRNWLLTPCRVPAPIFDYLRQRSTYSKVLYRLYDGLPSVPVQRLDPAVSWLPSPRSPAPDFGRCCLHVHWIGSACLLVAPSFFRCRFSAQDTQDIIRLERTLSKQSVECER